MITRTLIILLVSAAVAVAAEEKKTTTEKAKETASEAAEAAKDATKRAVDVVTTKTRQAWNKTKAYLADDPTTYRTGATQRLHELETEIAQLRAASGGSQRPYWSTMISAFEQQQQYAMSQLSAMPRDAKRKEATRDQLDRTIEHLEDHVNVAQREMRDFAPKR